MTGSFSLSKFNTEIIEYERVTSENLEDALKLLEKYFYIDENVSKCVRLQRNPEAIQELQKLPMMAAQEGLSVVAIDKKTRQVVGVAFNKIQQRKPKGVPGDFEIFSENCKHQESRGLVDCMIKIDNRCDLFDYCKVDCLLEIMFLGTASEYRGQGIARILIEIAIEMGKELLKGVNVKKHLEDGQKLTLEPVPRIVSAIFTSFISQKIGKKLDFETAAEIDYNEFSYEGIKYSDVIGAVTPTVKLVFLKL